MKTDKTPILSLVSAPDRARVSTLLPPTMAERMRRALASTSRVRNVF